MSLIGEGAGTAEDEFVYVVRVGALSCVLDDRHAWGECGYGIDDVGVGHHLEFDA